MEASKTYFLKGSIGCLLILLCTNLFSQNLIPNPGFDNLSQCPTGFSQIGLATPWVTANNGTPDVFNECSIDPDIRVPNAGRYLDSHQVQRSGTGYAGIYIYSSANWIGNECIETPLSKPLVKGKEYYIEFYVSPDLTPSTLWCYTDAIGMALSDTFVYNDIMPHESMPLTPIIENPPVLITDSVAWTRINGCYKAKGGEQYAIIGNFKSDLDTRVAVEDPSVFPYTIYYYIEDVLIRLYDPFPDTIFLCDNESVELKATFMDGSYRWNTGDFDSILTVNRPGIYSVETTINNCVLRDSVIILSYLNERPLPADTISCDDETLLLTCPAQGDYLWSNGSTERSITIHQRGIYSVSATNICGTYSFETNVQFQSCDCAIYVPNIISLNNDGINDALTVNVSCDYDYHISGFYIYDRWGNNLFTAKEQNNILWDGLFNGQVVQSGVYAWNLLYEVNRGQETEQFVRSGNITVLR